MDMCGWQNAGGLRREALQTRTFNRGAASEMALLTQQNAGVECWRIGAFFFKIRRSYRVTPQGFGSP
jgi:hypothetical protein